MAWDFLRFSKDAQGEAEEPTVHILRNMDSRAIGIARETVRTNIEEFENALHLVARLPEQFRLVMGPVENAVGAMALLRSRLEISEEALAIETRRLAEAQAANANLTEDIDRFAMSLRQEEASVSALRQRNMALESANAELQQEHSDLQGRLQRLEPQLRELVALRDRSHGEIDNLLQARDHADGMIDDLRHELSVAIDEVADRNNQLAGLQLANGRLRERNDEAGKAIGELEAALAEATNKCAVANTELARERAAATGLRAENKQLHKDAVEIRAYLEGQVEAMQGRYEFLEQSLVEARARISEENKQMSLARRERIERDREIGRLKLAIEGIQREANELRAQVAAAAESHSSTTLLLEHEIEQRHKVELELDMLRSENSTLTLKQKAASELSRSAAIAHSEALQKLNNRIAQLVAENDQLRSEIYVNADLHSGNGKAEGLTLVSG